MEFLCPMTNTLKNSNVTQIALDCEKYEYPYFKNRNKKFLADAHYKTKVTTSITKVSHCKWKKGSVTWMRTHWNINT